MAEQNSIKKFLNTYLIFTYVAFLFITGIFLWMISYFNISYPLTITSKPTSGELSVVGEGKIDIVPDTASVDLGIIVNNAKTVEEAQQQMNTVNNAIVKGVETLGIKKVDIKTSNYSINPTYNYERGGNVITGYSGNATITIKVRETAKLPEIIQVATTNGANQVMGTSYSIDKPESYREKAREAAIANAKEQAEKLANQLGIRLGKVTNIVESTGGTQPPMYFESAMALDAKAGTNIPSPDLQPGSQTITSTVTLYFEKR